MAEYAEIASRAQEATNALATPFFGRVALSTRVVVINGETFSASASGPLADVTTSALSTIDSLILLLGDSEVVI